MEKESLVQMQTFTFHGLEIHLTIMEGCLCGLKLFPSCGVTDVAARHPFAIQVREYLSGIRKHWEIPLDMQGSEFRKLVWKELFHIPYGQTVTYQDIARAIGRPSAVRAVANAIARNPVWLVCPCHRVIRSDGSLGGYAGGIDLKKALLSMEAEAGIIT